MATTTIGQLRDRVTIQQPSTSTDSNGGKTVTWGTLATVWASVTPYVPQRGAPEAVGGGELTALTDYLVTVRYRGDVLASDRVSWTPYSGSAKTLQIHGVYPDPGRGYLTLACGEVQA